MNNIERLAEAIIDGDELLAAEVAQDIVDAGEDLEPVIENLTVTMAELGRQFEEFEIFLPEMIMAADSMMEAMKVFEPVLLASGNVETKGIAVIGTAVGDMHEIGKDIVKTVLTADGFKVFDLGKNVSSIDFVNTAQEVGADIIGISALMTTTMPGATEVIEFLKDRNVRDEFKVMVGGAPTSPEWAERIGADGWSGTASEAVRLANDFMKEVRDGDK